MSEGGRFLRAYHLDLVTFLKTADETPGNVVTIIEVASGSLVKAKEQTHSEMKCSAGQSTVATNAIEQNGNEGKIFDRDYLLQ